LKAYGLSGRKRTISKYVHFLEEAIFILNVEKFSYSPRTRIINPNEVYLLDAGYGALIKVHAESRMGLSEFSACSTSLTEGFETTILATVCDNELSRR